MEVVVVYIIIGFVLFIFGGAAVSAIKESIDKRRIRERIQEITPTVKQLSDNLRELLKPVREIPKGEVDAFVSANQQIIDETNMLNWKGEESDLQPSGIREFVKQTEKVALYKEWSDSNTAYNSIQRLKLLSGKAAKTYKTFTDQDHYFTYSEMEQFKQTLREAESLFMFVLPKYDEYIGIEEKNLLGICKNIETERQLHNQAFIQKELTVNRIYFDTVLGQYPLDPQQRESLVKLEDNCLVIASAGSGKTSTILGKAKYLIERRHVDPSKILLITYTRKAANELHERMNTQGMTCSTFHALAYQIIAKVTGQAPSICEADVTLNVFHKLIETNKNFLHAINNYIINLQSLMHLEHDYMDSFTYFEDRKKYGIQALFRDVDDKIVFTRSEEEKRLVSILTRLGVPFRYENAYQYNTTTPERRQYRPDFTIYYQNHQGQWQWLYLEHFAIDAAGCVPQWFGGGTRGGWRAANKKYNEGIAWKRNTHRQCGTILIETTSADFWDGTVETKLRQQLERYGVPIRERSDEELYDLLVRRNRKAEKAVYTLILSFITLMKANEKTIDGLLSGLPPTTTDNPQTSLTSQDLRNQVILTDIIKPFFEEYERTLSRNFEIDFTDAILQATELCQRGLWKHYDYILVDEFQDISTDRYKFLQALRSNSPQTKLFCVGDDWQSIFRFAGSDMALVYEFEKYFGHTEQCKIETTYRFHQPLIDKSSAFVMKNKEQKEKTIRTPDGDTRKTYLNFVKCDGDDENGVRKEVEKIVRCIPSCQSILLLGRYNYDAVSVGYRGSVDMSTNRMTVKIDSRVIPFLSVHSAKGLEADHVILVNCNQGAYGFPTLIEDDPILDFVLSKNEAYPFAEERRLFYVAMTRARMNTYVLYDQKKPSPFIGEFLLRIERGSYLCPRCLEGKIEAIKDGVTINGEKYRSFVCSNKESGCDFFETKYGDLTPPGILITEETTAQDIERLREQRRTNSMGRVAAMSLQAPFFGQHYNTGMAGGVPAPPPQPMEAEEEELDDLPF